MKKFNFDLTIFKFNRKSLKTIIFAYVSGILLVTIIIMAAVNVYSLSTGISQTVDQMVEPLATEIAGEIGAKIDTLKSHSQSVLLKTLSSNQIGVEKSTSAYLAAELRDSGYKEFALFKSGSVYVCSDGLTKEEAGYLQETDVYIEARTNKKPAISTPQISEDGTSCDFMVATPGVLGVTNYTLVIVYDNSTLSSIIGEIPFGETGSAYLIDETGRTTVGHTIEDALENFNAITLAETNSKYKPLAEVYQKVLAGEHGTDIFGINGVESQVAFAPVTNSNWCVIMTAPAAEFRGPLTKSLTIMLILAGIILVVSFVLMLLLVHSIISPIIRCTKRLRKLAEGDLHSPVEESTREDEVGILFSSISETVVSLRNYIDEITVALMKIADGNLSFNMEAEFKGDFVQIKDSFNAILADLRTTFGQIIAASEQVNVGANQVSSAAQNLSTGASYQADAITSLSVNVDDISGKVERNANSAASTDKLVDNISQQIDSCNNGMQKMLQSMDEITRSSMEISKIIKVIDDIAFQTNILALNAAVEAAHAGNAGRGFAVVSDEVRNLANMSAQAAKQTTELIEGSLDKVANGTNIAKGTARYLSEIIESAAKISSDIKSIANASKEQSEAITHINDRVSKVTNIIGSNSSTAEQSAAAAEEMSGQSQMLKEMISKFRFDSDMVDLSKMELVDGIFVLKDTSNMVNEEFDADEGIMSMVNTSEDSADESTADNEIAEEKAEPPVTPIKEVMATGDVNIEPFEAIDFDPDNLPDFIDLGDKY